MNTSIRNNYDSIEQIIVNRKIEIKNLTFDTNDNLLFVVLNTNNVLVINYGNYSRLKNAHLNHLRNYQIIAKGKGVHWPDLDEDLSLKGFLKDYLENQLALSKPVSIEPAVA